MGQPFEFAHGALCVLSEARVNLRLKRACEKISHIRGAHLMFQLLEGALRSLLVRAPAKKFRAVAKSLPGHLVIRNLNDEVRPQGLPRLFFAPVPATGSARRLARKASASEIFFELGGQRAPIGFAECRAKADMVELP